MHAWSVLMRHPRIPRSAPAAALIALLLVLAAPGAKAQGLQLITAAGQQAVLKDPGVQPIGGAHADVIIVEYFDYNCPYCKKLGPRLEALLRRDPGIAILYKDWPVLGPMSVYAARAALAANWQGKYREAHDALLGAPRFKAEDQVDAVLAKAGIDLARLRKDLERHAGDITAMLARNEREADLLELQGTPGILVGRQLAPGAPEADELDRMIAAARRPAAGR